MKVLVAGGTGFIGRHLADALRRHGHEVTVTSRRPDADLAVDLTGGPPPGPLHADAVVNLVGVADPTGSQTFEAAHEGVVEHLLAACRRDGIGRFVHVGVVDVPAMDRTPAAEYRRTKLAAESLVRGSDLAWTLVRPALVYGEGDAMMTELVRFIRLAPVFAAPVPQGPLQLVDVRDLAEEIARILDDPATHHATIDVVGPESTTLGPLVKRVAAALDLPIAVVPLPQRWMAAALGVLSRLVRPPLTATQLGMLVAGLRGSSDDPRVVARVTERRLDRARIVELAGDANRTAPSLRILPRRPDPRWAEAGGAWILPSAIAVLLASSAVPSDPWLRLGVATGVLAGLSRWVVRLPWRALWAPRSGVFLAGVAWGVGTLMLTRAGLSAALALGILHPTDLRAVYAWAGFSGSPAAVLALTGIVVAEDLLWRGAITLPLAARVGPWRACLLAALGFSVAHVGQGPWLVPLAAALAGFGWGLLAIRSRSLITVASCHLVWDLGMLFLGP